MLTWQLQAASLRWLDSVLHDFHGRWQNELHSNSLLRASSPSSGIIPSQPACCAKPQPPASMECQHRPASVSVRLILALLKAMGLDQSRQSDLEHSGVTLSSAGSSVRGNGVENIYSRLWASTPPLSVQLPDKRHTTFVYLQ